MNGFSPKAYNYYLYTDDLESVIKTCIWIFSAIGGIWTQQFADAQEIWSRCTDSPPYFFDSNNCDIKLFICSFIWSNITKIL